MIKALGLEGASPAPTPGVAAQGETRVEDNEDSIHPELGHEETTMFRAVAARLNYLSQDRPKITFATMKLCSKDTQDLKNFQRVGRFLVGRPRVWCLFGWQARPSSLNALADVWARDRQSRKSVSGCIIVHGNHLIKAWTKQQSVVATSTADSELYAGNRAATESMGVEAFAKDLGRVVPIRRHVDSSAALSIISRTGLGKAKHIEIQYLWLQEAAHNNKLTVEKIPSEKNSSDLGTKQLRSERSEMLMKFANSLMCEALDTGADEPPRARWPRLRGSDRNPHVFRLAWCSRSRMAGRKIRSVLWWPTDCLQPHEECACVLVKQKIRLKKKPHARACCGSPLLGYDTHGGSTTKQGIGEEAGESYGKTSFLPVLPRMSKVIHSAQGNLWQNVHTEADQAVNPKVFLGSVPLSFVCA